MVAGSVVLFFCIFFGPVVGCGCHSGGYGWWSGGGGFDLQRL